MIVTELTCERDENKEETNQLLIKLIRVSIVGRKKCTGRKEVFFFYKICY